MKPIVVIVECTESNYSAYVESLPGCVATGKNISELKTNMQEAIEGHLEVSREFGDAVPDEFEGKYRLAFRFDAESLLTHYKGIFTNAALEKLTGINQRQLQRYASGKSRPMKPQSRKIQNALHQLGEELLAVEL